MHDLTVKLNKVMIVLLVASTIVIMVTGMSILKDSFYMHASYFRMQWDYLRTEKAFFDYKYTGILHWIAYRDSIVKSDSVVAGATTSSIPVLLYHGIMDNPNWKPDGVNISLDQFRDNMFALKVSGYHTITVEDYLDFINGKKTLPARSFMLTFDDGRKDSYYMADPVLRAMGFTAVMHIITGRSLGIGNETGTFHLSKTEIQKMIGSKRWEMESHGRDDHDEQIIGANGEKGHFLTNKLWLAQENRMETDEEYATRIKNDLLGSKTDIEKNLDVKSLAFAYPFGDYGQAPNNFPQSRQTLAAIADSIYPLTFTQVGSSEFSTNYAIDHASLAKRIGVSSDFSTQDLILTLNGSQDKQAIYDDNFSYNRGWLQGWGFLGVANNTLTIRATEQDDSSLAFLGGSYLWNDYSVQAYVSVSNGNAFTLAGRYRDGNNYAACDYYDNRVVLSQRVQGQDKEEVENVRATGLSSGRQVGVGISIIGNKASCLLDGSDVVSGSVDADLKYGGLSFKIWNSTVAGAQLRVHDLKVGKTL